MRDVFSVRHGEQDHLADADQVELRAINQGAAVVEMGVYDERIAGVLDDAANALAGNDAVWQKADRVLEDGVGSVRLEIERRALLLGGAYPFKLEGNQLTYEASVSCFYEYFLAVSTTPSLTKKPYTGLPRSFERVTAQLVKSYMGVNAEAFHTGAPRNPENGGTFLAAMQNLHQATGGMDWYWSPKRGYPFRPTHRGDGGLDFVVWKKSPDGRVGQLMIVGQCACGNDWDTKFGDLTHERLDSWFRPATYVPAIRCFATPFVLSDGNFLVANDRGGWTLDRIRLVKIAEAAAADPDLVAWHPTLQEMLGLVAVAA